MFVIYLSQDSNNHLCQSNTAVEFSHRFVIIVLWEHFQIGKKQTLVYFKQGFKNSLFLRLISFRQSQAIRSLQEAYI